MKKIKKILLFTHVKYIENKDIKKLALFLKRNNVSVETVTQSSSGMKSHASGEDINLSSKKSIKLDGFGLIIVFGGDGLFLSASKLAYRLSVPLLGVNFGKIGFLVDVDKKEILQKVKEIILGKFLVDKRMMIEASVSSSNSKTIKSISLNDIVIHNYGLLRMIQMKVFVNDYLINIHRSDGIIISTPTGSTAYSMSNGCPIVSPDANVISIVPISPHTYSHRPIIVNSNDKIRIEVEKKSVKNTLVTFDGHNNLNVADPLIVDIKKSSKQLSILHPSDYNYFKILNKKLKWGGRS